MSPSPSPIRPIRILGHYDISELEHKYAPLWFHRAGLQQTASGYGGRLATSWMVKLPGGKRWRRVYCCCYSNSGTCYVECGEDWVVIGGSVPEVPKL